MKYESPITITELPLRIQTHFNNEKESAILEAIKKVDIDVNKEELIKALQYDRHQYQKGYSDGYDDGFSARASDVAREIFEDIEKHLKNLARTGYVGDMSGIFDELKKKYESEGDK